MRHEDSVGEPEMPLGKNDNSADYVEWEPPSAALLARDKRVRATLECDVDRVLFDYSIAERNGVFNPPGLREAAESELARIQAMLADHWREEPQEPLTMDVAIDLLHRRDWCRRALNEVIGCKAAKQHEIAVAHELGLDGPLAICRGSVKTESSVELNREVTIPIFGCHRVFPDTVRLTGVMWMKWCPEHKAKMRSGRVRNGTLT